VNAYKHIFFDLDRTLWDFENNSRQTLTELIREFKLDTNPGFTSEADFIFRYKHINDLLWEQYRNNAVEKETVRNERFMRTFQHFNIHDPFLALQVSNAYIERSPLKTGLLPHANEILEYLSAKYCLHVITNGFNDVQFIKIENSGIKKYFTHIITSDEARSKKPSPEIFHYSLQLAGADPANSLMIGDSIGADCIGARNAGIDQVYFNPQEIPHSEALTFEIRDLVELKKIL
jgi:YjjG family noncanonical pyrimidine nucleotidase